MIPPMQPNKSVSSLDGFRTNYSEPQLSQRRRACQCMLATVCLLSVTALAIGCAVIVRQYAQSRSYEAATCRLSNITHNSGDLECIHCIGTVEKGIQADRERSSSSNQICFNVKFPCARIIVDFVASNPHRVHGRGLLYSDTAQASSDFAACSYSVCYATRDENARLVREFVERYELLADRSFNCYYDSETSDNVVDRKVYTRWDVVHCILWPCLLLVACAVVFLYVKLVRREGATYHVQEHSVDPQQLHHQHHQHQHQHHQAHHQQQQHRTSHNL